MTLSDTPTRFGAISVATHWILAALVIGLLGSGLLIAEVLAEPAGDALIPLHKMGGLVATLVVVWMLVWRTTQRPRPGALPGTPAPEAWARAGMHAVLLIGTVVLTVSGVQMSIHSGHDVNVLGLFTIPAQGENPATAGPAHTVHTWVGWAMVAAVIAHAGVGLKHHFVNHDETFTRMLGRSA